MLDFLYYAVSWVLLRWHQLLTFLGLDSASGLNWALSIVLLVITARLVLFRFFVKQVHSQRRMQEMQPKIAKLKEKHKGDRAGLQQEMMKLQKEEGFNPVGGCLPMVLQIPVFIGLFHTLRHLANSANAGYPVSQLTLYGFTATQTTEGGHARLFNAPLAASFHDTSALIRTLGGDPTTTRFVILPLLIISALATFLTQRLVMNNATTAPVGQAATIQRAMLYVVPLGVMASGLIFNFPLGVLLYWFTSNLWTLGQQLYIQKFHPHIPKVAAPVGEVGRTLAPPPGAKPRPTRGRASTAADLTAGAGVPTGAATGPADNGHRSSSTNANGPAKPRPGARPAGNRPPARRSGQRSKRR